MMKKYTDMKDRHKELKRVTGERNEQYELYKKQVGTAQ